MRAANEIQKITIQHFHNWAPASFRENYGEVRFDYGEPAPDKNIFQVVREGKFGDRRVRLYKPNNQARPRLYVDWGDELREQSYLIEHVDIDKLEKAFRLTFGEITWNPAEHVEEVKA
jgi:hypothetical protein